MGKLLWRPGEVVAGGGRTGVRGGDSSRRVGMEGELMKTRVIMEEQGEKG